MKSNKYLKINTMNTSNSISTISNDSNHTLKLHSRFLPHSAGKREETIEILRTCYSKLDNISRFTIDGSGFSSNVLLVKGKDCNGSDILLEKGIDGVISDTSKKIQLVLPVADCAAISVTHDSGKINGLFHGGYKGVSGNGDLGIIYNMLEAIKNIGNTDSLDEFKFYFSPMMGGNFELGKDYIHSVFDELFSSYGLDYNDYFRKHLEDNSKVYLDLKSIIIKIMEIHGINKNNISNKGNGKNGLGNITNSPYSNYPSFRLHKIAEGVQKKMLEQEFKLYPEGDIFYGLDKNDLSLQEIELLKSGNLMKYLTDYRLALDLRNY